MIASIFLKYTITILLFFFTGFILNICLSKIKSKNKICDSAFSVAGLFFLSIEGVFSVILIYGLFIQKFNSILILFLPLFIYYLFKKETTYTSYKFGAEERKNLLPAFLIAIILVSAFSLIFFDFKNGIPNTIMQDFVYYSKVSNYLNLGFENTLTDKNLLFSNKIIEPYHYFELWLNAFISKSFDSDCCISLIFITWPYMVFVIYLGFSAVISIHKKINFSQSIFLFVTLLSICFYTYIINNSFVQSVFNNYDHISIFLNPKYCFIVLSLLLSYYYYLKQKNTLAILWILVLPLMSTITLPGVCISLSFFLLFNLIAKKINFISSLKLFVGLVFYAIYIYSFYYIFNKNSGIISNYSVFDIHALTFIHLIYSTIFGLAGVIAFPILFLKLIEIILSKDYKILAESSVLIIVSFCIGGIGSLFLLYNMIDARQLLQLPYILILYVTSVFISFNMFIDRKLIIKIFILIIFTTCLYATKKEQTDIINNIKISDAYRKFIYNNLNSNASNVCIIRDSKDIHTIYNTNFDLGLPGEYSYIINDKNILITMYLNEMDSITDPNLTKDQEIIDVQKEYSYEYIYKEQNNITNDSIYFNKFNFKYIVLSKNAQIPHFLINHVKFCIKDSLSQQTIYKLIQ
jgi:hypothetical protein